MHAWFLLCVQVCILSIKPQLINTWDSIMHVKQVHEVSSPGLPNNGCASPFAPPLAHMYKFHYHWIRSYRVTATYQKSWKKGWMKIAMCALSAYHVLFRVLDSAKALSTHMHERMSVSFILNNSHKSDFLQHWPRPSLLCDCRDFLRACTGGSWFELKKFTNDANWLPAMLTGCVADILPWCLYISNAF